MHGIAGHHHISMITKRAIPNNRFYQEILGLRRVKVTVNQDEPSMYHLFYGDKTGSPGTELSFLRFRESDGRTGERMRSPASVFLSRQRKAFGIGRSALTRMASPMTASPPMPDTGHSLLKIRKGCG